MLDLTILNRHEKSYCKRNFIKIYQLGSNILFLWKRSSTGIFRYYSSAYTLPKKSSRRLVTFNWTNSIRIFAPFTRHATNSLPLCARMRVACACAWRAQFTSKSQSRAIHVCRVSDTNGRQRPQVYKGVRRPPPLVSSSRQGI